MYLQLSPNSPGYRQQGGATVWIVILLALAAMALFAGEVERLGEFGRNQRRVLHARYLQASATAIRHWYQRHLATMDATGATSPIEAEVLAGAGIVPRYGLRLAISQPLNNGTLRWHNIALWINNVADDSTTFDPSTGQLQADSRAQSVLVSGQSLQQAAWQASNEAVSGLLLALNAYAQQRQRLFGGDLGRNPFRPGNCSNVETGELPCLDNYSPASQIARQLGLNPGQLVDAWNGPLLVSSQTDANSTTAPYSMVVKAETPWGTALTSIALQSIQ